MGFMTGDKADQGKMLTLFCAWYCVVIYALCEALLCHAGKNRSVILYEMLNEPHEVRAIMVAGVINYVGELTCNAIRT